MLHCSFFIVHGNMPVEDGTEFSRAILDEAKQEAADIVDLAEREAERILEGAREELDQVYQREAPQAATQKVKTRYKQIVAAAELEARKQELLIQERLIAQVESRVQECLKDVRERSEYPALLRTLIEEGVRELNGEHFELLVDSQDRELVTADLLDRLQSQTGKTVTLSDKPNSEMTGVIVQRTDKRVVCDNRLSAVFQRRKEELRVIIAQDLFGE